MIQAVVELPDLHDAVLCSIEIDWEQDRARCTFDEWVRRPPRRRLPPDAGLPLRPPAPADMRSVVVTLTSLKGATIPRAEPWGASPYVNNATLARRDGSVELWIEMQSGDEIVIRAETAGVVVAPTRRQDDDGHEHESG